MKLLYTLKATAELDAVLAYIAERSPEGACSIQQRIADIIALIRQHPYAGQRLRKGGMRRLATSPYPYLVFYRVNDDTIVIHGIRHAARQPSSRPR